MYNNCFKLGSRAIKKMMQTNYISRSSRLSGIFALLQAFSTLFNPLFIATLLCLVKHIFPRTTVTAHNYRRTTSGTRTTTLNNRFYFCSPLSHLTPKIFKPFPEPHVSRILCVNNKTLLIPYVIFSDFQC